MRLAAFLLAAALPFSALVGPALAQDAAGGTVTLTFETGAKTGAVMVALFNTQEAYDGRGAPTASARVDVAAGQTDAVFEDLPAGDYAAQAFHDLNGDGEMNKNPFGMPTEPYAFSNNAVGHMGPASWDKAHFSVSGDTAQVIQLK